MTKLEQLANELAMLSNDSLCKLADILVKDYPSRADSLQNFLCWAEYEEEEKEEVQVWYEDGVKKLEENV